MSIIEKALEKLDIEGSDEEQTDQSPARRAEVLEPPYSPKARRGSNRIHQVKLDLEGLSRAGMVTPENAEGLIAEQCRYIKRPLLKNIADRRPQSSARSNLIMVTSAVPREGKTFMSVNLAMSIAMEVDRSVLLVDADIMRSSVCGVLGIEAEQGLTDFLSRRDIALDDVVLKTDVQNLAVLPSGQHHSHMTERFASGRMARLIEKLSRAYDVVLFDSMPLLARSGSSVLAAMVGQIVFVVEAVTTPQRSVMEALGLIDDQSKVGLVLNKSRIGPRSGFSYGYYDYGHAKK